MNGLLIIGNGFDLDLGLPTRYSDFANGNYWPENKNVYDGRSIFSMAKDKPFHALSVFLDERRKTDNWFDLEEALLDYAAKDVASLDNDLYYAKNDIEYYHLLQSKLCDYLINVQNNTSVNKSSLAARVLESIAENRGFENIISFNYTDLNYIAKQLGIKRDVRYFHMHGKLSDGSIILGVDETALPRGYESFHKTQSRNYQSNNIVYALEHANEIVVYGFSFAKIDWGYFDSFFKNLINSTYPLQDEKHLTIVTKDADSEALIKNRFREFGINMAKLYSNIHLQFLYGGGTDNNQRTEEFLNRLSNNE